MNYRLFFESLVGAAKTVVSGWNYKAIIAGILCLLLHKHAILFYCFTALVFLDCFTRWVALAYEYLQEQGEEKPTLIKSIIGIKAARSAGKISSDVMKHRFLGKISIYLICVMAAASADLIMVQLTQPTWAVATIIGYLTITELLSIIENLNAAGVEAVQGLIAKLKKKV